MDEITTTSEPTVEETSTTPVETASTSQVETSETTEPTASTSETEPVDSTVDGQVEQPTIDYEKSYKELQGTYTKTTQEVAELKKQVEQLTSRPQIVQANGEYNQAEVQKYATLIAEEELNAYRQSMYELDTDSQVEVNNLLNAYASTGNVNYLQEAKSFFDVNVVSQITLEKTKRAFQIKDQLEAERNEYLNTFKTNYKNEINATAPTTKAFTDNTSPYYNKDLADAVESAMGNNVPVAELEKIMIGIEQAIIKKYQDGLKVRSEVQTQTKGMTAPTSSVPTFDKIPNSMDLQKAYHERGQKGYDELVNKYGLEKILAQK